MNHVDSLPGLNARAHIADLVHRYAHGVRNGNTEACAERFTEDAAFEVREAVFGDPDSTRVRSTLIGRKAILDYLNRGGVRGSVCPLINNLLIQVDGRRATSNCIMTAIVWASDQKIIGEYNDSFSFESAWRFTSRVYTIFRVLT